MGQWTDYLKKHESAYENATEDGQLPDGTYTLEISDAEIYESDKGGVYLILRFENETGFVKKWLRLDDDEKMHYTKQDLARLGYKHKLHEIEENLDWFKTLVVQGDVARKNGYVNLYLSHVVATREYTPAAATDDSSEIPF